MLRFVPGSTRMNSKGQDHGDFLRWFWLKVLFWCFGWTCRLSLQRDWIWLLFFLEWLGEGNVFITWQYWVQSGRDSSFCVATNYGLDGSRIESLWRRIIPHPSRPALWPIQLCTQWAPGLSQGETTGEWRWPPAPSSAEDKEIEVPNVYSPSRLSWPVLGWTLPSTFTEYNPSNCPTWLTIFSAQLIPHTPSR